MASSPSISNHEATSNALPETKHSKKRRKIATIDNQAEQFDNNNGSNNKKIIWKSPSEQQIYAAKLAEALRRSRRTSSFPSAAGVRETADRVLAAAVRGRTRWSRAILTSRLRIQRRRRKAKVTVGGRSRKPAGERRLPVLQRKVKVLGRLVPGCRKVSFPNLLEETTDYIAALEMQVRAMAALAGLITGAGAGAGSNLS